MDVWEDVIDENTLSSEGILKGKGEPMSKGVTMLGPNEDEIMTPELAIEVMGDTIEILVVVINVGSSGP